MAKTLGYREEIQLPIYKEDHALGMMDKFNEMRIQKRGCDLLIKVEGKEIHVHRNVMMVGSDYFDAMFTHDMEEKQSGVVEMKDISFRIFNKCVEFIYTGNISLYLEDCEELLYVCGMLQLTSVCDKIALVLETHLNPKLFFNARKIAIKYNLDELTKVCNEFALKNLHLLTEEAEFSNLEKNYVEFIVSSEGIDNNSKLAVLNKWIKADVGSRCTHLLDLVALVDLAKISPGYGRHIVENEEVFYQSNEFMRQLYLSGIGSATAFIPSIKGTSRSSSIVVFDKKSNSLLSYQSHSKSWRREYGLLNDIKSVLSAVMLGDSIYVFMRSKKCYTIDLSNGNGDWTAIADMHHDRYYLRTVVLGDQIYVGGEGTMERYSIDLNKWEKVECSVADVNQCELVGLNGSIYRLGGSSHNAKMAMRFCPTSRSWSSIKPMRVGRQTPAATGTGEKIYVAGGFADPISLSEVEFYDLTTKVWTLIPSMVKPHDEFCLLSFNNCLFAVGHRSKDEPCCIEMFDIETEAWKIIDELENMEIISQSTFVANIL